MKTKECLRILIKTMQTFSVSPKKRVDSSIPNYSLRSKYFKKLPKKKRVKVETILLQKR